jgi:tetratricopeptide (TPR) repeat protein
MEAVSGQLLLNLARRTESTARVSERDRGGEERTQRLSAERWFQRGPDLEQSGAPEEIIQAYEKAIELDPKSAGALVNLDDLFQRS